mmetsp:Transcript_6773/g.16306  ORF Transcript_6773/g.16306 Transcript_6773/m.16306 type:complete len:320 (+) Transcript_6773:3462-4421(+)
MADGLLDRRSGSCGPGRECAGSGLAGPLLRCLPSGMSSPDSSGQETHASSSPEGEAPASASGPGLPTGAASGASDSSHAGPSSTGLCERRASSGPADCTWAEDTCPPDADALPELSWLVGSWGAALGELSWSAGGRLGNPGLSIGSRSPASSSANSGGALGKLGLSIGSRLSATAAASSAGSLWKAVFGIGLGPSLRPLQTRAVGPGIASCMPSSASCRSSFSVRGDWSGLSLHGLSMPLPSVLTLATISSTLLGSGARAAREFPSEVRSFPADALGASPAESQFVPGKTSLPMSFILSLFVPCLGACGGGSWQLEGDG